MKNNQSIENGTKRQKMPTILRALAIFIIMLILSHCVTIKNIPIGSSLSWVNNERKALSRKISWINLLSMDSDPTGRNIAWNSELPKFMQRDMKFAKSKNVYTITYSFKEIYLKLYYNNDKWYLSATNSPYLYDLTNFSFYKSNDNEEGEFVIYFYDNTMYFQKATVSVLNGISYPQTLTSHPNVPFDVYALGINKMNIGDYTLVKSEDSFSFYKDGKRVSHQIIPNVEWFDIFSSYGFLLDSKHKLYLMLFDLDDEPIIKLLYIGDNVDSFSTYKRLSSSDTDINISLPILIKNNSYYTIVPNDWDIFTQCTSYMDIKDFQFTLKDFKSCFKKAEFEYSNYIKDQTYHSDVFWSAILTFSINEKDFYIRYQLNGYDDSFILTDEEIEKFSKTVYTLDEFWKTIEEIRNEYLDYYDHKGKYSP